MAKKEDVPFLRGITSTARGHPCHLGRQTVAGHLGQPDIRQLSRRPDVQVFQGSPHVPAF